MEEDKKDKKRVLQIPVGLFAVVKDEKGKEKEVDMRRVVGSRGDKKK